MWRQVGATRGIEGVVDIQRAPLRHLPEGRTIKPDHTAPQPSQHPSIGQVLQPADGRRQRRPQLRGLTTVQTIHTTNGSGDLIPQLATETLDALDTTITKIRNLEGVKTSETNLLLATRMTTRP